MRGVVEIGEIWGRMGKKGMIVVGIVCVIQILLVVILICCEQDFTTFVIFEYKYFSSEYIYNCRFTVHSI